MTDQLPVLVVDLDGTLLRTDLLHETFWSAFSRDWLTPIKAARALWSGKPSLKSYLYTVATVDITSLPYNDTVINYILSHRERGGHTALVTASNHKLATQVGDHLDLFDETHGSDEKDNLKGQR
ncbi:MAG: prenyltransferase, partial [Proteobacteria bacterium]|nr:prenyltransferase [Pseudomonadota bacterium]